MKHPPKPVWVIETLVDAGWVACGAEVYRSSAIYTLRQWRKDYPQETFRMKSYYRGERRNG